MAQSYVGWEGILSMHGGVEESAPSPLTAKAPPATGGSATAVKWAENPIGVKVGIAGWVIAESNSTVNIILNNVTNTITGIGTNDATNVIPFFVQTRTMEPVLARVEGDQVQEVYFELIPPTRTDYSAGGRNRGKQPKGYRLYVDDVEKSWMSESTNAPSVFAKEWKVLVRAELKSGPGGAVEDIAEGVAPGDGSWPQVGPGKSDDASVAGIKWEVPIGRLRNGKSASNIRLAESGITADIYTPWCLLYESPVTNRYEVNALYNENGLRQILSIQGLVDVVTNNATSYELRFYPRTAVSFGTNTYGVNDGGFYDVSGSAHVIWRISNPDAGAATNRLQFEEIRGTNTWTSLISYNSTNTTWRLEYGTGADLRIEERRVAFVNYPIADRLETNVVMNASNQIVFICVESYHPYEWDWELISTVTDPAGAALTTTYAFYDDNLPSQGYGQLKHTIYPDGYWEKRTYNGGALRHLLNPWQNEPASPNDATVLNSKFTEYRYGTLGNRTLLVDSCEHVKLSVSSSTYTSYLIYGYVGTAAETVVVYRETYPWPWESETIEGEFHINGCYGAQYASDDAKGFYNGKAGEMLNGLPYAALSGWSGVISFAHHQGTVAGTNFTVFTGENWSEEWAEFPTGWRSIQTYSVYYGAGDEITSVDGQTVERYSALNGFTTNVVSILQGGCKVRDQVWVYFSPSSTNGPTNNVLFSDLRYDRDAAGRLIAIVKLDPTSGHATTNYTCQWEGALKISETDAAGATTLTAYDSLKRPVQTTKLGWSGLSGIPDQPDTETTTSLNAASLALAQLVSANGVSLLTTSTYDLSKRLVAQTTPAGTMSLTYSDNGRQIEASFDNGTFARTNSYLDRKPQAYEGSGMVPQYFKYDTLQFSIPGHTTDRAYTVQRAGATNSPRFFAAVFDSCGRPSGTNFTSTTLTHGVRTFIPYDLQHGGDRPVGLDSPDNGYTAAIYPFGNLALREQKSDYSGNWVSSGYIDPASIGPDFLIPTNAPASPSGGMRGSVTEVGYRIGEDANLFRFTTNSVYLNADLYGNFSTPAITQIIRERLTGFTGTLVAEVTTYDLYGATNTVFTYRDPALRRVTEVTQSSLSTNQAVKITVGGLLVSKSTFSKSTPTTYTYDAFGRQTSVTTPAGITLYTTYDQQLGLKLTQTDFAGNTNYFEYYPTNHINAQQLKCQTDSRGKKTYFAYNARNQLVQTWGDVPYPEERVYNDYGEMVELHTFRGGTNWQSSAWPTNNTGTADVTRWTYQEATGLLFEKVDAKSNVWTYAYDELNRPAGTTWSRLDEDTPVSKQTVYNKHGEVVAVNYSNGAFVTWTNLNALGLPTTIVDDSGEHTLAYDPVGRVTADAFAGVTNCYTYDQFGRNSLTLTVGTNTVTQTNTFDAATGRLLSFAASGISATYSYLTNAELVSGVVFSNSTGAVLTTAKTFEYSSRLKSITNTLAGGSNVSSHVYLYDAIHRRTNATLADGSYWCYGYDDRSQLTSAKRYWSGGGVVAGQQYEYSYDSIGNRTVTQSGGSQFGTSLRQSTWTVNELNQTITNAAYGYVNIFGEAVASATVTVNHESVYRNGDFYRKELLFSNSSGPVYPSITNVAVINNYGTNGEDIVDQVIGNVWVPRNPETLLYDEDGNLIQDSRWAYRWDAENRLKEIETLSGLATNVPVQKLVFTYDHQGRRASKALYAWDAATTNYLLSTFTRFIYDGWNLLAELDVPQGTNAPVLTKSFLWGLDLSGTPDQAGGIGGLLAISQHSTNALSTHLPCFDGNGNVMALVHAGSGQPSARYEYAPFGEPLRVNGEAALLNPFRFSTKYTDDETGFLYYGYRYYSPALAKWLSRDPLAEIGGINLYAFCNNNPVNRFDIDGRIAPLAIAYVLFEIAAAAWDIYDAIDTITDPDSDIGDITLSVGGVIAGIGLPGGGYGTAAKKIVETTTERLLKAGSAIDKGDLTKAGRALEKHGSRPGSHFPQATGNAADKNEQGREILKEILTSNNQTINQNRWGGRDYFDANTGRGVRYDGAGIMMGFLEAY